MEDDTENEEGFVEGGTDCESATSVNTDQKCETPSSENTDENVSCDTTDTDSTGNTIIGAKF